MGVEFEVAEYILFLEDMAALEKIGLLEDVHRDGAESFHFLFIIGDHDLNYQINESYKFTVTVINPHKSLK